MKNYIFVLLSLIPLMIKSQSVHNITPDSSWIDKNSAWYLNGTTFYTHQDTVFCGLVTQYLSPLPPTPEFRAALRPSFYLFNKDHSNAKQQLSPLKFKSGKNYMDYYGYPGEQDYYYPANYSQILGKTFFFEFNGALWYFHHIQPDKTKEVNYECFAHMNRIAETNILYYDQYNSDPDVVKNGAFQLDSLLFFFGINQNKTSANYGLWCLQQYSYDSISGKFIKGPDHYLSQVRNSMKFGGFIKRIDSLQHVSLLMDTYNSGTPQNFIGLLTYVKTQNTYVFNYRTLDSVTYNQTPIGAVALSSGSLKGQKNTDDNPNLSDRIEYVMISSAKSSDGHYHMVYREFFVTPASQLSVMNQGEVVVGNYPYKTQDLANQQRNEFEIVCGTELIPHDWSDIDGTDAFQSRIAFFYPDKNGHLNAAEFLSDMFLSDNSKTVSSTDLDQLQTYPYIKGLWTLVGIVDGAPPCSIDWNNWGSTHANTIHPTELSLKLRTSQEITTSVTYDDQWSVGANFEKLGSETEKSRIVSLGLKYFGSYQSEFTHSSTVTNSITKYFSLSSASQDLGGFLYAVPEINRYEFKAYPWWDQYLKNPVPNTLQYLFRATGLDLNTVNVPLTQHPFYINHPNDPSMLEWVSGYSRSRIIGQTDSNSVPKKAGISWTSPVAGDDGTWGTEMDFSSKYTHTSGFSEEYSTGINVPHVFQLSGKESYDFSYSTTAECKTTTAFEVEASLKNLEDADEGPQISQLAIDVFYLKPDSVNQNGKWNQIPWYYYDSLNGMKPWYVAYVVNTTNSKIRLLSPYEQNVSRQSGFLFSWETEGDELTDFTVFVYKASSSSPSAIIYQQPVGDARSLDPVGFTPEPGKTYYWRVKGRARTGDVVWSQQSSFTVESQQGDLSESALLKTAIYPNPGHPGEMKLALSAEVAGLASYTIYATGGVLACKGDVPVSGAGAIATIKLSSNLNAGIYVVEILFNGQRKISKMVIL